MNRKNTHDNSLGRKRTIMCILAIMLTIILTFPSFASNENDAVDQQNTEAESPEEADGQSETDIRPEPAEAAEETDSSEDADVTDGQPADQVEEEAVEAPDEAGSGEDASSQKEETAPENKQEITTEDAAAEDTKAVDKKAEETKVENTKAEDTKAVDPEPGTNKDGDEEDSGSPVEEKAPVTKKRMLLVKADDGKKVSYSGSKVGSAAGETTVFTVKSDGTKYTGTCAQQGVQMSTSGTATITKISNSKKIAKVIYHYAIELDDKNWWTSDHKTDKVGTILGMSSDDATNVTKRRMIEAFCQIYNMGTTDWYKTITNANTGGWSTDTADRVRDFYTDISNKNWYENLTVPDGFEIWIADAGSAQAFMIWAYDEDTPPPPPPPVYVTLKKTSGNTDITG